MEYRVMEEKDIDRVVPVYIDYYNNHEDCQWTRKTTYKRIHQVWNREDSLCLILEEGDEVLGFAMGYFEQYEDLSAYDLVEIVIDYKYQNKGLGTKFMEEIEHRVIALGGKLIQLEAVNDEAHERFYDRLKYQTAGNLLLKSKFIGE